MTNVTDQTFRFAMDFDGCIDPTYEAKAAFIPAWRERPFESFKTDEEREVFIRLWKKMLEQPFDWREHKDHALSTLLGDEHEAINKAFDYSEVTFEMPPIEGMLDFLRAVKLRYPNVTCVLLSSGYDWQRRLKEAYVKEKGFPIEEFYWPGKKMVDGEEKDETKADVMHRAGADIICEDRFDYSKICADAGYFAVLLLRYSWSYGASHPNIFTANHVNGLLGAFDGAAEALYMKRKFARR